jgi:hypothetical protein
MKKEGKQPSTLRWQAEKRLHAEWGDAVAVACIILL